MRAVALIVNPSAGGGRAAKAAARAWRRGCARSGSSFRTELTRDLRHARELAREAAAARASPPSRSPATGWSARSPTRCAVPGAVMGVLPGGRGNDFARVAGHPARPRGGRAPCSRTARRGRVDLGDVDGRTFIGIASLGFDSEANRIANEAPPRLGRRSSTPTARCARWRPGSRARFDGRGRRRARARSRGWSVAAANSKAYGGGMFLAPDARPRRRRARRRALCEALARRTSCGCCRRSSRARTSTSPGPACCAAPRCASSADRPFTVYADGDPIGELPVHGPRDPAAVRVLLPA